MNEEQLFYIKAMAAAGPKKRRQTPLGSGEPNGSQAPSAPFGADGKAPEKSTRELLAEDCARIRRSGRSTAPSSPLASQDANEKAPSSPSVPIGTNGKAPAIEQPIYSSEIIREAMYLQTDLAMIGLTITAGSAIDHCLARRKGTLSLEQIAREAALERSRLAARGVAISTAEAVRRVSR